MKKILFFVAVASIVGVAALNLNLNMQKDTANLLTLANTEALASGEGSVEIPCTSSSGSTCDFQCTVDGVTKICTIKDYKKI